MTMTTQSRIFFVKSFKGLHPYERGGRTAQKQPTPSETAWPANTSPGRGSGPQIEAGLPRLQQPRASVDLLELEHRARSPALALRPLHERVREVLLQPPVAALGTPAHRISLPRSGASSTRLQWADGEASSRSRRPLGERFGRSKRRRARPHRASAPAPARSRPRPEARG